MKKLLCVVSRPPYESSHAIELLETALVGAVFEFPVSVLFRDEGVWCLLPNQNGTLTARKTMSKFLQALPTYEINDIYVCSDSLAARRLQIEHIVIPSIALTHAEQAALIGGHDVVIGAAA